MFMPIILPLDQAVTAVASAEQVKQSGVGVEEGRALTHVHLFAVRRDSRGMLTMGHSSHSSHASHASHASSSGGGIGWTNPVSPYPSSVITVPGAPAAVSAAPDNGAVDVSWAAVPDGGDSAITYSVVASPGGAVRTVAGATRVRFDGLTNGVAYTFIVIAANSAGQGPTSTATDPVVPLAPQLESHVPVIVGKPAVGHRLIVDAAGWAAGTALTYRWRAGGRIVAGADGRTFRPTKAMVDEHISVEVAGVNPAYARGTSARSEDTAKVARVGRPSIAGNASVGSTLRARPGTWTAHTRFTFAWLVGGKRIHHSGSSLTVLESYTGKTIAVRVTGRRNGYDSFVVASAKAKVRG